MWKAERLNVEDREGFVVEVPRDVEEEETGGGSWLITRVFGRLTANQHAGLDPDDVAPMGSFVFGLGEPIEAQYQALARWLNAIGATYLTDSREARAHRAIALD